MIKKTLVLLALTVNLLGVAEGTFAAESDFRATSDTRSMTEALETGTVGTKGKELNGFISGQFLSGTMTAFVKGEGASTRPASDVVWNGFVTGTAALSPRETEDVAVLPTSASKGRGTWGGYVAGSLGYWQR